MAGLSFGIGSELGGGARKARTVGHDRSSAGHRKAHAPVAARHDRAPPTSEGTVPP